MILIFIFYIIIVLVLIFLAISFIWRRISEKHSTPCPVWMKFMLDPHISSGRISRRTKRTVEFLDVRTGMRILDAGCGPGRLTIPLAEVAGKEGEVAALDVQAGMLDEVKKRAEKKNLSNIRYINAGLGEGSLEKDYYDRAVLITVLGEIPGKKSVLEEIFHSLKPGGVLLIEETIRDPHFQKHITVKELAESIGFSEEKYSGSRFSYMVTYERPLK